LKEKDRKIEGGSKGVRLGRNPRRAQSQMTLISMEEQIEKIQEQIRQEVIWAGIEKRLKKVGRVS